MDLTTSVLPGIRRHDRRMRRHGGHASKEIVRSAVFLAVTFVGVAITYLFLNAEYLVLIQILVYVGAINVLILFGIMLTKSRLMGGGPCE